MYDMMFTLSVMEGGYQVVLVTLTVFLLSVLAQAVRAVLSRSRRSTIQVWESIKRIEEAREQGRKARHTFCVQVTDESNRPPPKNKRDRALNDLKRYAIMPGVQGDD
jgi:K+ transporter